MPLRTRQPSLRRPILEVLEDRIVLNNRFVVPLAAAIDNVNTFHSLGRALTTTGLNSGDFIQIETRSSPGGIFQTSLPSVTNLTIRAAPGVAASDMPNITTNEAISIAAGQAGLTLDHLNLTLTNTLTLNANVTMSFCHVTVAGANGILLNGTSAVALLSNTIINTGVRFPNDVIKVVTAAGGHNVISGNTIQDGNTSSMLEFTGAATIADRVTGNTFIGSEGSPSVSMILVGQGVNGLTIQSNTFSDRDSATNAIDLLLGAQNIGVVDNVIDMPFADAGIQATDGSSGVTTSLSIVRNQIRVSATGIGVFLSAGVAGATDVKMEGNNFLQSAIGALISSGTTSVVDVDLGGGDQGSLGANNFRLFTASATSSAGAIIVFGPAAITVNARNNLFASSDPATFIFDHADDATRPTVVSTGSVSGNPAFVEGLYLRFLNRVGNLADPGDAGYWVSQLAAGASAASVANSFVRSTESLSHMVVDLFHTILKRDAQTSDVNSFVTLLQAGQTLEQVQALVYGSPEYQARFAPDRAFIVSLYADLLARSPSEAEIVSQQMALATVSRGGLVTNFLGSAEYRRVVVTSYYSNLLKRSTTPTAGEVAGWVTSGMDLLSIMVGFTATPEGQAKV